MPNPVTAPWILRGLVRLSATVATVFGLVFAVVDPIRFSAPSFAGMLTVPGAPQSWGVLLLLSGLVTLTGSLTGRRMVTKIGLTAITCWNFFFALTFLITFFEDSRASVTGVFAYAWLTLIHACLAAVYDQKAVTL